MESACSWEGTERVDTLRHGCGGYGHGHAMAGGEKLSAAVEKEARERARA